VTLVLDPVAVRRVVVARQGLASRARTATVPEIEAAIVRLGCVQIDSVTAVDRAHRLTLAVRLGRLPADGINELRRRGRVFEYWAHEACLLPIADYRYFEHVRRRGEHPWWDGILTEHRALADRILADIVERGPLSARSYGGAGSGYWEWTPAKKVFEALWTAGEVAVAERRGFERMYDLTERVIPAEHRGPAPATDEVLRHLVERTVHARGVVTRGRLGDYYRVKGGVAALAVPVAELVAAGRLVACRVGEHEALCDAEAAALAEAPPSPVAPVLLCPFDNLIWDREETRRLFGFSHALEIYKPQQDRVWGYYVLPLLVGDRLVGRVDLKADRKAGVLRALAVHWEGRPAPTQLARAMERLAHALGLAATATAGVSPRS
jgi:uncharacterized protein YcaQ